jgi:hypothetical protein
LYSLAFGATAGGFAVLRPRFAAAVIGDDDARSSADSEKNDSGGQGEQTNNKDKSMLIFGVLTASRGVAIVASGFVTEALVKEESSSISGYGGGAKWRDLMVYTGVMMAVASFGALGRLVPHSVKIRRWRLTRTMDEKSG